jgi:long-chain-fatty-acyl-CoA reductase
VVWGGLETIKYFVKNFDPTKKLITFGPKYSISVIDKDVLEDNIDSDEFYEALAWDICLWEQRACSSVQKIYIIGKLENSYLERFSKKLSDKLKNFFIERGELSFDEYTELFKYEEINIAHEVLDNGKYFDSVFWDYYIVSLTIGPLNRMVYVNNVDSIDELCSYLKKSSTILQSCSMKTNNSKNRELYINKLANCGITRFVDIGNIGFNEIFIPHEGEFILRRFSKLVSSYVKDNH